VRARARIMVARYGGPAYWLARDRARAARGADAARDRFWGKVAVEIARLDGRVIGLGTGERWR
ncbi:hypothetical protein MKK50_15040, partial [Methylobacterium sp. J-043]|nr:hypothetical protein [Methylobacterium sp. J-043]